MNKSIKIMVGLVAIFAIAVIAKNELYNYKFHEIKQIIAEEQSINVAVSIKHNGREVDLTNNKQAKYPTASIVKLSIIAQLMHKNGNLNNLTANQIRDTKLMMEQSDNEAATRLLVSGLGSKLALKEIIEDLNLKDTKVNSKWGLTQTTSKDQIKVLDTVFNPDNQYLNIYSKEYI